MRLGILADTHDNVAAAEAAVERFERADVAAIIHRGDFVAPPTVAAFEGHEFHGVLGNNDGELDGLERTIDGLGNGSHLHGRYADLTFDDTRIGMLHGDQGRDAVEEFAAAGTYDYVCYGHFHERDHRQVEGTTVINPGAHFPTVPADHRTVVVLDTGADEVSFVQLDGE